MSFSVPGTIITPVPITKLPNKSDHSTRGSGSWRVAGVFWGMDGQKMARCGAAKRPRIVALWRVCACAGFDRADYTFSNAPGTERCLRGGNCRVVLAKRWGKQTRLGNYPGSCSRPKSASRSRNCSGSCWRSLARREQASASRWLSFAQREQARAEGRALRSPWRDRVAGPDMDNQPFVIRFKGPVDGDTIVEDLVQGRVTFHNRDLDDLVLLRTDGAPTYNLAVVVDDHDMGVTHVIRGDDHLNNAATRFARQHVTARIDRGIRRVTRQGHA